MTYLELVNAVLRRIREPTVGAVSENTYSTLIGELVNDAKRTVEDAWQWSMLSDNLYVVTVNGTSTYNFSAFNCAISGAPPRERTRFFKELKNGVPLILNVTDTFENEITLVTPSYNLVTQVQAATDGTVGIPNVTYVTSPNTSAAAGQSSIRVVLYPTPNAVYTIRYTLVNPQNDLSAGTDVLLVPSAPVLQLAYLYALYERGEEVGEAINIAAARADNALADAIAHNSGIVTNGLLWHVDYMPDAI